ncbi:LOW QUALITY PROTEIN: fatty acid synthase-like [Diorhabda carinulata]|uniref:LOW QUALITY PROTEIN: fatty acid synthase-like n=1 Tax=Diorhabda carinulata TaxID=1163345 RepID=UPI0025A268FF|nr:LOW QUALITY PROTEIN: fatty acid synthase-like [Diorhabda carinulata]
MDSNDKFVISGLSGKFPQCNNVEEFKAALFNGTDLVTEEGGRYEFELYGTIKSCGRLPEIDKFDANFFGIPPKQANLMDPRQRLILESIYECIYDSGYNPNELRGSKTGVYVGLAALNIDRSDRMSDVEGYLNMGLCLALAANKPSFCLDFKGPTYSLDAACASSLYALTSAMRDLECGEIESAVISATQLVNDPLETLELQKLSMVTEGRCKSFSTERNGYVRSESIVSFFIQKKSNCRRLYCEILGAKANADGFKKEGISYPLYEAQYQLVKELYESINITPDDVDYFETHGTGNKNNELEDKLDTINSYTSGTIIGDEQECTGIVKYFKNRKSPLLVGSVKSNMGHAEQAAGLCSIIKAIITMETGIIPANLYSDTLDKEIPGMGDNTLKLIGEHTKFEGSVIGINCFGFGGENAHTIIKSNAKEKIADYKRPKNRLVQVSGRTQQAVMNYMKQIQQNQDDVEFLALVDQIHKMTIEQHNFRGYTVMSRQQIQEVGSIIHVKRPIWFIYSGIGTQWCKVGQDLMRIPIFSDSINRCAKALEPHGIDLVDIITNRNSNFEDAINVFCSIVSVGVALTDVLQTIGIIPDGIAGHSVGEVVCAYADGTITAEEAILLAYARGYSCKYGNTTKCQMAAVGISKEEIEKIKPDEIAISCQNAPTNITISGPQEVMKSFTRKLSSQGIFAKLVNSMGFGFHSQYVKEAGVMLLDMFKKVLKDPKPRSSKWISTSVPPNRQNEEWTKYSGVEYHHNNFCNTALFDQVYQHVPENAIVIEISGHGLLQAILKKEMGPGTTHISVSNRFSGDNEQFLLSAIGKIFLAGGQPDLTKLYTGVTFPVGRGTKMLSPLLEWDHSITWRVPIHKHKYCFGDTKTVNLSNEKYSYLADHEIDGKTVMPLMGYIDMLWEVFSERLLKPIENLPIVIEDVKFHRSTVLSQSDVNFLINIMHQSGKFEISESGSVVCTGTIRTPNDVSTEFIITNLSKTDYKAEDNYNILRSTDIYKELFSRGYGYNNIFRGLRECNLQGIGKIRWNGNFCSFLDSMLHLDLLSETSRDLRLPVSIKQIVIDPATHLDLVNGQEEIPISNIVSSRIIKSGGIEITGVVKSGPIPRINTQQNSYLEDYDFVYYEMSSQNNEDMVMRTALQIILQNNIGTVKKLKICEIVGSEADDSTNKKIKDIFDEQSTCEATYFTNTSDNINSKYDIIVVTENVNNSVKVENLSTFLEENGFILFLGNEVNVENKILQVVYQAKTEERTIYILKPNFEVDENSAVVYVNNTNFNWLKQLQTVINNKSSEIVYLVSQNEEYSGVLGLMNCLLTEPGEIKFRSVVIDDEGKIKNNSFSLHDEFYKNQLKKNLTFNVLKGDNRWGTYVHLPAPVLEKKEAENAYVDALEPGNLSTMTWIEKPIDFNNQYDISVHYSAINFHDVVIAKGEHLRTDTQVEISNIISNLGREFSGVTSKNKRIMGLTKYGALALKTNGDPILTWDVPTKWSLRDAATVPYIYTMCYYSFVIKGKMKANDSILILKCTTPFKMAAINVALSMGCKAFVAVESEEEKDYLKKMCPMLNESDIGDLTDKTFVDSIIMNTEEKGVNVVLNSVNTDLLPTCFRLISHQGIFLETEGYHFQIPDSIKTKMTLKNNIVHLIFPEDVFDSSLQIKEQIKSLLVKDIQLGVVKPLPNITFDSTSLGEAFECFEEENNKVLIEVRNETNTETNKILAVPKIYFSPNKSYVIIGGLGGFGLEIAEWMIRNGARNIVLNSTIGIYNGYQSYCLKKWSSYEDVVIKINQSDTSTLKGAEELIKFAQQLGPVGGLFNMALVLKDASILDQTEENFYQVYAPKLLSGQNMDLVTRNLCKNLDYFVVFSSVASGRGIPGQSNYGMANSALERLCEKRKMDKLPAVAIQWGPMAEIEYLTEKGIDHKVYENIQLENFDSCLKTLEYFLLQQHTIGCSAVLKVKNTSSVVQKNRSPIETVAHLLGISNLETLNKSLTLSQHGLDSLLATEIKNCLLKYHNIELTSEEIREMTFSALLDME